MKPFWITTTKPMTLGYGITAHSAEDAESLLRLILPAAYAIDTITWVQDVQSLDQRHVVPNMGDLLKRGIWFPRHDHLPG
jgi:hypothetical protein